MRFDVVTLFPEIFDSITKCGITARAMKRGLWSCHTWNPRAMTEDVHRTVDDRPFGGGPGMVMQGEPVAAALRSIEKPGRGNKFRIDQCLGGPHANSATTGHSRQGCQRIEGCDAWGGTKKSI